MKWLAAFIMMIIVMIDIYVLGVLLPALVSAKVDEAVILAPVLGFFTIMMTVFGVRGVISLYKK